MPPLEALAATLVTDITAGLPAVLESVTPSPWVNDTPPDFLARWGYDNNYIIEDHKPSDPVDVFFMPKGESSELIVRDKLEGTFEVDIAIRQRLTGSSVAETARDEVLVLRAFTDTLFYYWSPLVRRKLTAVDRLWTDTNVQAVYVPDDLGRNLFFAVATLTFKGIR